LYGLPAVVSPNTRLLVLGSFPGVASLKSQRYYGHPQNQFWRILGELWSLPLHGAAYEDRIQTVREKGLGIWDVYASCEREGSLDAHIRHEGYRC
jgi:hypoxanthine-DNA glycosylase